MQTLNCPHCNSELETMKELIQLHNEDYWINHCEESFNVGRQISSIDRLPEAMKNSERIKKYYNLLNEKIKNRNIEKSRSTSGVDRNLRKETL